MPTPTTIPAGTVVRDTYTVDSHIASGAFADVYRVRHRFMGMQAMKVLRDGRSEAERSAGLLEAFRLSRISHPNIVRVFDGNCLEPHLGGHAYVTMELVDGGTLGDIERPTAGRPMVEFADVCDQLAQALAHAHSQKPTIVHRDIKPTNVLLSQSTDGAPLVRLADFGLAVPIDPELGFSAAHGTIAYRSPESLLGFENAASDVYAWGLTMYEAATGVYPFAARLREAGNGADGRMVEALKVAHGEPITPPAYFRRALHPALGMVLMRSLEFDHRARIQDGNALHAATQAVRRAVELDPTADADTAAAVDIGCSSGRTQEAVDALVGLLRRVPSKAPAYVQLISFLKAEASRLGRNDRTRG